MLRRLILFLRYDTSRQLMLVDAIISLSIARARVLLVPFPKIAPRLGEFVSPARAAEVTATRPSLSDADIRTARLVAWSIRLAVARLPFECVCLPRAMAGHAMLKRRGIASRMHFGAALNKAKPIDAHAWLDASGVRVTGYPVGPDIAEIGCFV